MFRLREMRREREKGNVNNSFFFQRRESLDMWVMRICYLYTHTQTHTVIILCHEENQRSWDLRGVEVGRLGLGKISLSVPLDFIPWLYPTLVFKSKESLDDHPPLERKLDKDKVRK